MDKKLLFIPIVFIPMGFLLFQQFVPQIMPLLNNAQTTLSNFIASVQQNPVTLIPYIIPAIGVGTVVFGIASKLYAKAKQKNIEELTTQALKDKFQIQQDASKIETALSSKVTSLNDQVTSLQTQLSEKFVIPPELQNIQDNYTKLLSEYTTTKLDLEQAMKDRDIFAAQVQALKTITVQKVVP